MTTVFCGINNNFTVVAADTLVTTEMGIRGIHGQKLYKHHIPVDDGISSTAVQTPCYKTCIGAYVGDMFVAEAVDHALRHVSPYARKNADKEDPRILRNSIVHEVIKPIFSAQAKNSAHGLFCFPGKMYIVSDGLAGEVGIRQDIYDRAYRFYANGSGTDAAIAAFHCGLRAIGYQLEPLSADKFLRVIGEAVRSAGMVDAYSNEFLTFGLMLNSDSSLFGIETPPLLKNFVWITHLEEFEFEETILEWDGVAKALFEEHQNLSTISKFREICGAVIDAAIDFSEHGFKNVIELARECRFIK